MPPKRSTRESTRTSKPDAPEKVTTTKKATTSNTKKPTAKAPAASKKSAAESTGAGRQSRVKDAPSTNARKSKTTSASTAPAKKRKAEAVETEPTEAKPVREPKKPRVTKPLPAPKPKVVINHAPTTKLNVYVCGEGSSGELGLGTAKTAVDVKRPRLNPLLAADTVGVVQVAVGGMHCVALTHDNKILTWGVNDQGALGRDTTWEGGYKDIDDNKSDSDSEDDSALNPLEANPTAIPSESFPSGTVFVEVAAGDSSSFALTDDGLVYGWGTFRVR